MRMRARILVAAILSAAGAGLLWAQAEPTYMLAVPAAASAHGVSGEWRTELVVANPNEVQVVVHVEYLPRDGGSGGDVFQMIMEAGQTAVFPDILGEDMHLAGAAGALLVRATRLVGGQDAVPVRARARVYNQRPEGIFGQGLNAQPVDGLDTVDRMEFPGLEASGERYTNLALVNPYEDPQLVAIELYDLDGFRLDSTLVTVEHCVFFTDLLHSLFDRSTPERFSLVVRGAAGTPPIPTIASIVERATGDATTVEPIEVPVEATE